MSIDQVPVALLAGGLATRLGPLTVTQPKALIRVAGRPFIDHQLALLRRNGIRKVVLCLGHFGALVEDHVGDGSAFGLEVVYSHDGTQLLGTGGALRRALPLLGEVFWVLYGDAYPDIDYQAVLETFQASGADGLMTVLRNGNRWDRSNVVFRDGRLLSYDKRNPSPEMDYIDYGASLLRGAVVAPLAEGAIFDLADAFADLVRRGQMIGYEVTRRFYEIGSPAGLAETDRYLRQDPAA